MTASDDVNKIATASHNPLQFKIPVYVLNRNRNAHDIIIIIIITITIIIIISP